MPFYSYECTACAVEHEVFISLKEELDNFCPNCGSKGTLKKILPQDIFIVGDQIKKKEETENRIKDFIRDSKENLEILKTDLSKNIPTKESDD